MNVGLLSRASSVYDNSHLSYKLSEKATASTKGKRLIVEKKINWYPP